MSSHVPSDPLIGTTVSQFAIVAKLGGGGMGVVYQARDLKLGRLVALKFLPPQWSHDEGAKQRFIREAQAASATQHRNICTIHNIETAPDGRLFIVMAHYEGETLKQRLERGALPIADAIQIGLEIAEGLAKAHAQGVVHRDIKPGNIILTDDGVKIVDFGLAKFADALQLTVPGSTIGTFAYMSPEQTRGEEADAQSDIWAWGIVMFQMLTGAPPFRGAYPEATFYAIKNEPLPSLRHARPDISEALEQIVTPALEKDRAQRYTSAREPARALRLLQGLTLPLDLRTQGVSVPAALLGGAATPAKRRVFTPLRALLILVVGVVAASGWWLWAHRPVTRVAVAVVPVANHTGVADLDRYRMALTETLTQELSESPNLRTVPYLRLLETIRPFILRGGDVAGSEAVQAVAARSGAPFLVVPTLVYRDRDTTWVMQTQVRNSATGATVATYETSPVKSSLSEETAFRLTSAAAIQIQQHFREHGPGRAFAMGAEHRRARHRDGAQAFVEGLGAYELMEYRAASDAFSRAVGLDDQDAMTFAWLARTLTILGRKSEALTVSRRARNLVLSDTPQGDAAFVEAVFAESSADDAGAEPAYRRLAAAAPDEPLAQAELADYLKRRQDRNPQAIEAYHAVLAGDPGYLRVRVDLCQLHTRLDDFPLANREGTLALEGARTAGNGSIEAQAMLCLAEALRKSRSNIAEARRLAAEARRIIEPLNQPYNLARAVFYQASMAFSDGQLDSAGDLFTDAAARLSGAGNRTMEATALMNVGLTRFLLGRPTQALEFYARSEQAFRDVGDERRAAEMDVNRAGLEVTYGLDVVQARRRLSNARTNLERMGHIDFLLSAMQNDAEAERYEGRIAQSQQALRAALQMAKDRQLTYHVRTLSVSLVQSDMEAGEYADALLLATSLGEGGTAEGRLLLARVLSELGEQSKADEALGLARQGLASATDATLLPRIEAALGQVSLERGDAAGAIPHFEQAVAAWHDPLLPAAVVEALCGLGEAEGLIGRSARARQHLDAGRAAAERLGRDRVLAQCQVRRARFELGSGHPPAAVAALADIVDDDDQQTIGRPLRVSVEYLRARALEAAGDPRAAAHLARAQALIADLQQAVPPVYRDHFVAKREIREILGVSPRAASAPVP